MYNLFKLYEKKITTNSKKKEFIKEVSKILKNNVVDFFIDFQKTELSFEKTITETKDGTISILKKETQSITIREFVYFIDSCEYPIQLKKELFNELEKILININ